MKKQLLLLLLAFMGISLSAQNSVPNSGFENWSTATCENPQNYQNTSNSQVYYGSKNLPFNVVKTTDAWHGQYAVQLTTVANATDTAFGYFININPDQGPSNWVGGMPYSEKPTGLRGYYKYNVASGDSATIIVIFSKLGVNIGTYFLQIGQLRNNYTLFDLPFNPPLSITPDSVAIGVLSCKFDGTQQEPSGLAGSSLTLDSISFTGVASQPEMLNGDFELWKTQEFVRPDTWYIQTDNGEGIYKTTDAVAGNFAIEIKTYLGNENSQPSARQGRISTGYYDNNCDGNCQQKGGFPFALSKDTLTFFYKYIPVNNDKANSHVSFKKNGINIGGWGIELVASATYKYMEIPFDIGQTPDTVIVEFQSSLWENKDVAFVGSDLFVDEIWFKSQIPKTKVMSSQIDDAVTVFPNPSVGKFQIRSLSGDIQRLEIFNAAGVKVKTIINTKGLATVDADLKGSSKGVYIVKVYKTGHVKTQKIIIE